ncbi:LysR family transcriptional regulator [Luteimonas yindakuii]|uniref:LysR family transcriptional regulator n=1 Tax=Luteimonas yindakuii TaxID=2565782 RepID=UPI0010A4CB78|nr:LysR family transcriptional regulator [Luteimonas yindakuii]QCO66845.1 LysR family transcriptional regulator [Luteimonas yindakuii]
MDRIDSMRAFVVAVRANGFAAAARELDVPRSKVSKQIRALEDELGVQLLMRTTRSLHLTEAGTGFYEAALEVLDAFDEAGEQARAGAGQVAGVLRVNAPVSFGIDVLGPLVPGFHALHPDVRLQIHLSDALLDPVAGGFDVTIRIADLVDSSLVARRLMPAERVLVASPGYLRDRGVPASPDALATHAFLNYGCMQGGVTLPLSRGGETVRVSTDGPVVADNGDLLSTLAEADMGIALLPRFIVQRALDAGRLRVVLSEWSTPPIAVNALYAATRRVPLRTRRFIDFLAGQLDPHADG